MSSKVWHEDWGLYPWYSVQTTTWYWIGATMVVATLITSVGRIINVQNIEWEALCRWCPRLDHPQEVNWQTSGL